MKPFLSLYFSLSLLGMLLCTGTQRSFAQTFTDPYNNRVLLCGCDILYDLPAVDLSATNNNLGFEKGNLSNWLFFEGYHLMSYPLYTTINCGTYTYHDIPSSSFKTTYPLRPINSDWIEARSTSAPLTFYFRTVTFSSIAAPGNNFLLKIGNEQGSNSTQDQIAVLKIRVNKSNPYLTIKYALGLSMLHLLAEDSHVSAEVYNFDPSQSDTNRCTKIQCLNDAYYGNEGNLGNENPWKYSSNGIKDWTTRAYDLSKYFLNPYNTQEEFLIVLRAASCTFQGHQAVAYFDLENSPGIAITSGSYCMNSLIKINAPGANFEHPGYSWTVYKGATAQSVAGYVTNQSTFNYRFAEEGNFTVKLSLIDTSAASCSQQFEFPVQIIECGWRDTIRPCADCIQSFAPLPNKDYVLSAWVKQQLIPTTGLAAYSEPRITLSYTGSTQTDVFTPSGPVIDGWQRIEQKIHIPASATKININLVNTSTTTGHDVLFDDIRMFPFDGDMKSFVYDPVSQKLVAELDENHYATFYEYDEEGKLKRVKKETERGIMTIKEAGSNTHTR